MRAKAARPVRIQRIAAKVARREALRRDRNGWTNKPFKRKEVKSRSRPLIAYDLETTRIAKGTPRPLYLTACGADFWVSTRIDSVAHLGQLLVERFLTDDNLNARFVAWNGNGFDAFFIGAALLSHKGYILRPYLTRGKSLRGMRVQDKHDKKRQWEFLDGIAMTGIVGKKLGEFLDVFTPDMPKLNAPDWDKTTFDPDNEQHRRYAERDSEGLYHAITRAHNTVFDAFGVPLQPTIGNTGIRIFARHIPHEVQVWEPPLQVRDIIRKYAMRGGYCYCMRPYEGPVWKYDLNQAYAAAMRDAWLPCGRVVQVGRYLPQATAALYLVNATNPRNTIPFYYRSLQGKAVFGTTALDRAWICALELEQLRREGWRIEVLDGYIWDSIFQMREFVDKLERMRMGAPDGPNGAEGLMYKAIGNNSYGKTVEELDGMELLLSAEQPDGFHEFQAEDDLLQHVWFRFKAPQLREYHQPQIGMTITAHVRMEVRRAALQDPDGFLYADTDCTVFDNPQQLNIDPKRYGFWKQETDGENYRIITKKVYASFDAKVKHAKGITVRNLTADDFARWYAGQPPKEKQVQRQNFIRVMTGADMFVERSKVGQKL